MKRKNQITNQQGNIREIIKIITDEYSDFQKSTTTEEKLNHISEITFGTLLYLLVRYDYDNYLKMKNNNEEGK